VGSLQQINLPKSENSLPATARSEVLFARVDPEGQSLVSALDRPPAASYCHRLPCIVDAEGIWEMVGEGIHTPIRLRCASCRDIGFYLRLGLVGSGWEQRYVVGLRCHTPLYAESSSSWHPIFVRSARLNAVTCKVRFDKGSGD
jgi:hypothetical protein